MATDRSSALSPEYALLGLLRLKPGHGYEVHQRLARDLGALWTVHQNQAYNILNRLEAAGFVRGAPVTGEGTHARRRLSLTPAGRRRFDDWLRAPTGLSVRALRVGFLTRLYFAQCLDSRLAREIVEQQLSVTRQGLERLRRQSKEQQGTGSLAEHSADLRLRQLKLALAWLENLRRVTGRSGQPRRPARA